MALFRVTWYRQRTSSGNPVSRAIYDRLKCQRRFMTIFFYVFTQDYIERCQHYYFLYRPSGTEGSLISLWYFMLLLRRKNPKNRLPSTIDMLILLAEFSIGFILEGYRISSLYAFDGKPCLQPKCYNVYSLPFIDQNFNFVISLQPAATSSSLHCE